MKNRSVTAWAVALLAAAVSSAQSTRNSPPVHINLDEPPAAAKKTAPAGPAAPAKPAAPATGKVDPNKPAAPADAKKDGKSEAKKKEDEIGKIEGMEIPRGGGFLGLQVVNGTFRLSFYDAKKKPAAPDVVRAVLRWNVSYQKQPERVILVPGDKALVADKTVRPPYSFKLFLSLFKGEGDENAENLTVDFSQ
ncbi:MAG: hypothetical protein HZA93_22495 [Verrucomicrobia bacterium]|nr:hypothetical protein [Verrucomicrobiota bacterium]